MESQESIIANQSAATQDTGALITEEQALSAALSEAPKKKSKVGIIVAIIATILIIGGAIAGTIIFLNIQENARIEALKEDAKAYIKIVSDAENNILYYPYSEYGHRAQLDKSPYNREYLVDSYVTNYFDHTYICLTDGKKRISGYTEDGLTIDDSNECNYQFINHAEQSDSYSYNEKQAYLENYAKKEYKFLKPNVEIEKDKYLVKSSYFNFEINAEIVNQKIAVNDDDFVLKEKEFYATAKGTTIAEYFLKKYFKTDNLRDESPVTVPDIDTSSDITDIQVYTEMNYEPGKEMMLEFQNLIKEHKVNMPGVVLDLRRIDVKTYKLKWYIAVGQRKSDGEYIILESNNQSLSGEE